MNIRSTLTALVLMAASIAVIAGGIDADATRQAGFGKLSEAEKAEVLKTIADKAANKDGGMIQVAAEAVTSEQTAKKADAWLNVGERIGKMISGAAKEVGVAVNDFVKTPVGQTAMVLIVWHYMGGVIVHVVGAILVLVVGIGFIWFYSRRFTEVVYMYHPEQRDMFGRAVLQKETHSKWSSDGVTGFMFATALVLLLSIAVMFSY